MQAKPKSWPGQAQPGPALRPKIRPGGVSVFNSVFQVHSTGGPSTFLYTVLQYCTPFLLALHYGLGLELGF